MTTNRLAGSQDNEPRIIAPKDPEERIRFWISHGNHSLYEQGRGDLEWACDNGNYYIRKRA
jgi:hypothetical protein